MVNAQLRAARREGRRAARQGEPFDANPYIRPTLERAWRAGYNSQQAATVANLARLALSASPNFQHIL